MTAGKPSPRVVDLATGWPCCSVGPLLVSYEAYAALGIRGSHRGDRRALELSLTGKLTALPPRALASHSTEPWRWNATESPQARSLEIKRS